MQTIRVQYRPIPIPILQLLTLSKNEVIVVFRVPRCSKLTSGLFQNTRVVGTLAAGFDVLFF